VFAKHHLLGLEELGGWGFADAVAVRVFFCHRGYFLLAGWGLRRGRGLAYGGRRPTADIATDQLVAWQRSLTRNEIRASNVCFGEVQFGLRVMTSSGLKTFGGNVLEETGS
jgi:hypothetical protein